MTWTLIIIGDSYVRAEPSACMVIPVQDKTHDYAPSADTVEQLCCEQFHDTYPHHVICDLRWVHEEDVCQGHPDHDMDLFGCKRCGVEHSLPTEIEP